MENETAYINEAGVKDLVTFHDAQFEITDGCYFNEIESTTITDVIRKLYDLRVKLKKDQNPAGMVIKLLMNNMYCKTAMT